MVAPEQHLYQTIALSRKLATGSKHDYLFAIPPSGILFEVLRIADMHVRLVITIKNDWTLMQTR